MACGLWPVACGLWPVACGLWPVGPSYAQSLGKSKFHRRFSPSFSNLFFLLVGTVLTIGETVKPPAARFFQLTPSSPNNAPAAIADRYSVRLGRVYRLRRQWPRLFSEGDRGSGAGSLGGFLNGIPSPAVEFCLPAVAAGVWVIALCGGLYYNDSRR